ncbi:MAG TPA: helix-turn-helix transcriptional regulator [Spirochaetota bacterium]|nr:helix-turn-helix transcriptional regulator [Spirochaetota bacterium]HPI88775.1 helix-turn-helix transcriptional regulator [Spirochaetota bacterium]HPR47150.1 helix-turn-helix transcriptional regulator [Spirochaetota bacterium]
MTSEKTRFTEKQLNALSRAINEINSSIEDPAFREILLNTYEKHFDLDYCHLGNPEEDWSGFNIHLHAGDNSFMETYQKYEEYCIFKSPLLREIPATMTLQLDLNKTEMLTRTNPLFNALSERYGGFIVISGIHKDNNGLIGIKIDKTSLSPEKLREHRLLSSHFINSYHIHNKLAEHRDINAFFCNLSAAESRAPLALCDHAFKIISASDSFFACLNNHIDSWNDVIPELMRLYGAHPDYRTCLGKTATFPLNKKGDMINLEPVVADKNLFYKITVRKNSIIPPITPREREIHRLISLGLTNKAIAGELGISTETVKRHIANIFIKTGATNRTELSWIKF